MAITGPVGGSHGPLLDRAFMGRIHTDRTTAQNPGTPRRQPPDQGSIHTPSEDARRLRTGASETGTVTHMFPSYAAAAEMSCTQSMVQPIGGTPARPCRTDTLVR